VSPRLIIRQSALLDHRKQNHVHGYSMMMLILVTHTTLYLILLKNVATLLHGSRSEGLDFPKDTFWNEFLGIYVLTHRVLG